MTGAVKAAKAAGHVVPLAQKYTLESTGIWDWVRRKLAIDPNRSSGVPLNSQFRVPMPGSVSPLEYDDPVTLPAADIADNPYWQRDARRNYPQLSTVTQADAVSLLTVGSQAAPKDDVLKLGEAGEKQIVSVKAEGEERGLAGYFEKAGAKNVLAANNGFPPVPPALNHSKLPHSKYELGTENGYPEKYTCRTFV